MTDVSTRNRRAIVAGGVVVGLAIVVRYMVLGSIAVHRSAAAERELYRSEARLIAEWQASTASGTSARELLSQLEAGLFQLNDPALVSEEMRTYVSEIAATTAIELMSVGSSGEGVAVGAIQGREFSISGFGDFEQVLLFLNRLEEGYRHCRINELRMRRRNDSGDDTVEFTAAAIVFAAG